MTARLDAWLTRLEARAPESRIELGLERVDRVYRRLLPGGLRCRVITIAGTNGKGSAVAFIEAILGAAGYPVLAYTSPHIVRFTERVRIDAEPAAEDTVADAFDAVEQARRDQPLTYFEHVTLGAVWIAAGSGVDVAVLEVGLGGRLDAVNVVDSDVAAITSIGLDHRDWLGRSRAQIAREKAGVARAGRPLIVGEKNPPKGMDAAIAARGARVLQAGRDFNWRWGRKGLSLKLPGGGLGPVQPGLPGRHQGANAAVAALAVRLLGIEVPDRAVVEGLAAARLPGRFQVVRERPRVIVDVAHNPPAVRALRNMLQPDRVPTRAVFAALADKDAGAMARILDPLIDHWYAAGLGGDRARSGEVLAEQLDAAAVTGPVDALESVAVALDRALDDAGMHDRVVVFGSFLTVAAALDHLGI